MSSNVPQLRFPEFDGEWEKKKLGDVFKTRNDIGDFEDLPIFSLTIKDGVIAKPTQYEREHLVNGDNAYKKIVNNDFVYNPMNLRFGALKVYKGNIAVRVSKYYDIFYTDENTKFWEEYLVTYNSLHYYNKMAEGTLEEKKRVHYSNFVRFLFPTPTIPEQEKIAAFLTSVDEKIQALKKKKELLEQYKKGTMQKLFSQELRFKQDDGSAFSDWEEKKLNEVILKFIVPMRDKPKELTGEIPWCRIEDFDGKYLSSSKSEQGVSKTTVKNMNLKINPINTLLVSCSANLGFCAITKNELITNQTFIGLVPNNLILDIEYLYYVMKLSARRLNVLSSGTTISYLSRVQFEKFKIPLPSLPEQQKISDFLSSIDESIENVGKQIEALQEWKKGLLQKMFV